METLAAPSACETFNRRSQPPAPACLCQLASCQPLPCQLEGAAPRAVAARLARARALLTPGAPFPASAPATHLSEVGPSLLPANTVPCVCFHYRNNYMSITCLPVCLSHQPETSRRTETRLTYFLASPAFAHAWTGPGPVGAKWGTCLGTKLKRVST